MKKFVIVAFIIIVCIVLTACGVQDSPNGQDHQTSQEDIGSQINQGNDGDHDVSDIVVEEIQQLEGELVILAQEFGDFFLRKYIRLFNELHPNVQINFEFHANVGGMESQTALMTRLLADPPDIFSFSSASLPLDKIVVDAIFEDIYLFMNGPRGIDQRNYFSNIFRASEIDGGLYHVPTLIEYRFALVNTRLLDAIDVDVLQISSLTIDDEMELFLRIAEAMPDEEILLNRQFSIFQPFMTAQLYCMDTGEVFVNTPEFHSRLERAMEIPIDEEWIQMMPSRPFWNEMHPCAGNLSIYFLSPQKHLTTHSQEGGFANLVSFFLQEHPDMQFSQPIVLERADTGGVGFRSFQSLSIMRNSPNKDLAWEFIRFMMEHEENWMHEGIEGTEEYWFQITNFAPINRTRFDNQFRSAVEYFYDTSMRNVDIEQYVSLSPYEHREQSVTQAVAFVRDKLGQVDFEIRTNFAVFFSLIYPELWLLHSGQQDVSQTLANLQSRLEIYVAE